MTVTLVTGGAGFIGSHLVDALVERGHRVRVLDSLLAQVHEHGRPDHLNAEAELIVGDVGDEAVLDKALDDVSVVFHEAAEVGVGQSMYDIRRYVRANTFATSVLLEKLVARRASIRKVIVASSMSLYGEGAYECENCGPVYPRERHVSQLVERQWELFCEGCGATLTLLPTSESKPSLPTSVYAITKQDQEQLSLVVGRAYDMPTVALRYFNAYGTRQALSNPYTGVCAIFLSRLLSGQPPVIFEDGNQSRDFIHVSDVVRGNLLALETDRADYQAINIGTGVSTTVLQVAEVLAAGLGQDIKPEITGRFREGDIRHCVADISRAQDLLDYRPQVSLEQGLPDLLEWVRGQGAIDRVTQATLELEAHGLVR